MGKLPRLQTIVAILLPTLLLSVSAAPRSHPPAVAEPPAQPGPRLDPQQDGLKGDEIKKAIADGVRFLKSKQLPNGSWPDADQRSITGTTSLATLALLAAGESPASRDVDNALVHLEQFDVKDLGRTYAVALQTMVFAAADPNRYRDRLMRNVAWLEKAQLKPADPNPNWPGAWTYDADKGTPADNSNSHYALLALDAARRAGVAVNPEVWRLARDYWHTAQRRDGAWGYMRHAVDQPTSSMTCAGIASVAITNLGLAARAKPDARAPGGAPPPIDASTQRGLDWLAQHYTISDNFGKGQLWKYYYLEGLSHAARLTGHRQLGDHDWYREGADHLLKERDPLTGQWKGSQASERDPIVATSFAVLFLAHGRDPNPAGK